MQANVFQPEKKRRKRDGYDDGDYTLFKKVGAEEFVKSSNPITVLGTANNHRPLPTLRVGGHPSSERPATQPATPAFPPGSDDVHGLDRCISHAMPRPAKTSREPPRRPQTECVWMRELTSVVVNW